MRLSRLLVVLVTVLPAFACGGSADLAIDQDAVFLIARPDGCAWPDCRVPTRLGIADFDGDGARDIVSGGHGSTALSLLLGNRFGAFELAPAIEGAATTGVDLLAVGTFDAGGTVDVAVVDAGTVTLHVLLGDGAGGFTPAPGTPVALPVAGIPTHLVAGPIAGGSRDDLLVVDDAGYATVLLTAADGSTTVPATSPFFLADEVGDVALAALDDDALPDLAVADAAAGTLVVRLGDGAGAFAALGDPIAVGPHPVAIAVEFFDLGPEADLAVLDATEGTVDVLLGAGDGTFAYAAPRPPVAGPGEGLDLIPLVHPLAPNYPAHLVVLRRGPGQALEAITMLNPGDGRFADGGATQALWGETDEIHAAPLSQDGVTDLAWPDAASGAVRILFGTSVQRW